MANDKYNVSSKDNFYDDDFDNDGLDEFSDDYDDDDRYDYQPDGERNRVHTYSGSGQLYDASDDSRLRKDHHNQLERKRRASIKSSYTELREAIPSLRDNKASRSVILQKAVEYLEELQRRNTAHVNCVDHFSSENATLESKCREMENQVQMILRQNNRNNGFNTVYPNYYSSQRQSYRATRDDEDSNDLSGSTNSTPTASTSKSIASSSSNGTYRNDPTVSVSIDSQNKAENSDADNNSNNPNEDDKTDFSINNASIPDNNNSNNNNSNNNNNDSGSNFSGDCYDDVEEIVSPKKPRKT